MCAGEPFRDLAIVLLGTVFWDAEELFFEAGLFGAELYDHAVGGWGGVWGYDVGKYGDEAGEGDDQQGDDC